jgi:hypothetical protein
MQIPSTKVRFALLAAAGLLGSATQSWALAIKSVGSVERAGNTQITVVFDEAVQAPSATTIGNYTLTGSTIASAELMTGLPAANLRGNVENPAPFGRVEDNQCVVLTVTGSIGSGTKTLQVSGVQSVGGQTLASTTRTFTPSGYAWSHVGDPGIGGRVIAVETNGFDIYSNGSANWNANDQGVFVWRRIPRAQPFDLRARVEFQDISSRWARAGILIREGLNENAATTDAAGANPAGRNMSLRVNPARCFSEAAGGAIVGANNAYELIARSTTGGGYGDAPGGGGGALQATPPPYPNAWMRFESDGTSLRSYWSEDGRTWLPEGGVDNSQFLADTTDENIYIGTSFFPEGGNINADAGAEVRGRRFLMQIRFNSILGPVVSGFQSFPNGFSATIIDGADAALQDGSVTATLNGSAVAVNATRSTTQTNRTRVAFAGSTILAAGSTNTVVINYRDSTGISLSRAFQYVLPPYVSLNAAWRVQPPTGADINGMQTIGATVTGQAHGNSLANVEGIFAGRFPTSAEASVVFSTSNIPVINFWNSDGKGNFNDNEGTTGLFRVADDEIPNVSAVDEIAVLAYTYLDLAAGTYRMVVNSDDGFRVSAGATAEDASGLTLGVFDGGRGASDSAFEFVVTEPGIYPFRLLWWEGGGGASCEWFAENLATGQRLLINQQRVDPDFGIRIEPNQLQAGAIRAYNRTPTRRASVVGVTPAGFEADVSPTIQATIALNGSTVSASSVTMTVNGTSVTPQVSSTATTTTISYVVTNRLPYYTRISGVITFRDAGLTADSTINFNFVTRPARSSELAGPGVFVVEAEDFDFNRGQNVAAANTMPYVGGAYDGQGAVNNVDFSRGDGPGSDGFAYRTATINPGDIVATPPGRYVPHNTWGGAATELNRNGDVGNVRPGQTAGATYETTTNFKIGWVGGQWYNYTRSIPATNYNVYAALSFGDNRNLGSVAGRLEEVTAGRGTTNQTLRSLGSFNSFGTAGWGPAALVALMDTNGAMASVALGGSTPTTLRFYPDSGDYDWFVLIPAAGGGGGIAPTIMAPTIVGGQIRIEYTGTLLSAPTLSGPYTPVSGASSPYLVTPTGGGMFYRTRQ